MSSVKTPRFRREVRSLMRARIVKEARSLALANGWSQVTMGKIAAQVGVSRQTLYAEVGTKSDLALLITSHEVSLFLAAAAAELKGVDLRAEVEAAVNAIMVLTETSVLARSAMEPSASFEMSNFMSTGIGELIDPSMTMLTPILVAVYQPTGGAEAVKAWLDSSIRVLASHVMSQTQDKTLAARRIGFMAQIMFADPDRWPV